jgi:hypothetical protein
MYKITSSEGDTFYTRKEKREAVELLEQLWKLEHGRISNRDISCIISPCDKPEKSFFVIDNGTKKGVVIQIEPEQPETIFETLGFVLIPRQVEKHNLLKISKS